MIRPVAPGDYRGGWLIGPFGSKYAKDPVAITKENVLEYMTSVAKILNEPEEPYDSYKF